MAPLRACCAALRASLAASRPPPMAAPRRGACRPPAPRWLRPLARPERPRRHPLPVDQEEGERGSFRPWGGAVRVGNWTRSALSTGEAKRSRWARAEGSSCPRGSRRGRESPRRPRRGRAREAGLCRFIRREHINRPDFWKFRPCPRWNPRQIRLSEELLYKKIGVVRLPVYRKFDCTD